MTKCWKVCITIIIEYIWMFHQVDQATFTISRAICRALATWTDNTELHLWTGTDLSETYNNILTVIVNYSFLLWTCSSMEKRTSNWFCEYLQQLQQQHQQQLCEWGSVEKELPQLNHSFYHRKQGFSFWPRVVCLIPKCICVLNKEW